MNFYLKSIPDLKFFSMIQYKQIHERNGEKITKYAFPLQDVKVMFLH